VQRTRINCVRISSVGSKKLDCRAGGRLGSIPGAGPYTKGLKKGHAFVLAASGPGGYFLIRGQWGCAAGCGRIFTTGLTIMGSHFH